MKLEMMLITPEIAVELMARNLRNRPLQMHWVKSLADAMASGEWMTNGESIKIDADGNLIDGQHRLAAIIKCGRPMMMSLTTGVPTNAFSTLDQGKRRSGADVLALNGDKNVKAVASALRTIVFLGGGQTSISGIRTAALIAARQKHPDVVYWTERYIGLRMLRQIAPASVIGIATLGSSAWGSDTADFFLEKLATGEMLDAGSPVYVLRQRLIESKRGGASIHQLMLIGLLVKAWNAYVLGKRIKLLRMHPGEPVQALAQPT